MNKIVFIGMNNYGHSVYCRVRLSDGNLSITGVESPLINGDCKGGCGQIDMHYRDGTAKIDKFDSKWSEELWLKFLDIWDKWHLNNMTSYCEHVDLDKYNKELTVEKFKWGNKFHSLRENVLRTDDLDLALAAVKEHFRVAKIIEEKMKIYGVGRTGRHMWDAECQQIFDDGYIELEATEVKQANGVYPTEHPEGMLCSICPVCGYKQGSAWLTRELPNDVIAFIEQLPKATKKPAWVIRRQYEHYWR